MGIGESETGIQTSSESMRFTGVFVVVASFAMCWGCSNSAETVNDNPKPLSDPVAVSKPEQTGNSSTVPTPESIGLKPRGKKMIDSPASGSPPPLQFRRAAEDSEIAPSMNERGEVVETRVFKSHPQIVRAEAVWKNAKDALLKITLRDGKTIDVKTDRLVNLQTARTRDLMEISGIQGRVEKGRIRKKEALD